MVLLNNKKLFWSILGGVLVITGVVLKNSFEQMKVPEPNLGTTVGMTAFAAGWILTGLAIATNPKTSGLMKFGMTTHGFLAMAASFSIFTGVLLMKSKMKENKLANRKPSENMEPWKPMMFVGGWLLVAFALAYQKGFTPLSTLAGFGACALVLSGMMFILPEQRKQCVVDGPGMPMFTAAWALIAFANAL